jgi:hypothetical protein
LAHIQKVTTKGGRIRFQARYIDPAGRERAKNFTTRAEARAFIVEMESRKRWGEWMAPELGRRTFGEWAEHVEASRINLRENPRLRDAWVLKDLILPTFEQVPIAAIHQDLVQGWVKKLSQAGYAATTVKKAYQTFARIMAAAVGKRIARNPCVGIVLPPDDPPPPCASWPRKRSSPWRMRCHPATGRSCSPPPSPGCVSASWPPCGSGM